MKIITIQNGIYTLTDKHESFEIGKDTFDIFKRDNLWQEFKVDGETVYFFGGGV